MINTIHSIHFVGIKGVGMAPLAIMAKEAGVTVTGSDIADEFITDASLKKVDITPFVGFSAEHVGDVELVVTTGAHGGFDNVEVIAAKEKKIPVITQGEAVGVFMQGNIFGRTFTGISIAGSHGKTTTTAMVATIFQQAQLDPSYIIGTSDVPSLGESGHFGKGDYFIAEADEYATEPTHNKKAKLLWQYPKIAVITNIELDHPDVYPSVEAFINVLHEFVDHLPKEGILICNGDDKHTKQLLHTYTGKTITFGTGADNDYHVKDIIVLEKTTTFCIENKGKMLGEFTIAVTGEHNALNATAAILTAMTEGIAIEKIVKGIGAFSGSKRRLEYIGTLSSGALIYDDYAHHPTEIQKSLQALSGSYSHKKIIVVFQPHTYSRTKVLFDEFTHAFEKASEVILMDIYASLREPVDPTVSSVDLARQINLNTHNAVYLPKPIDVVKYIQQKNYGPDTVIVTMGAGDIYKLTRDLTITYG